MSFEGEATCRNRTDDLLFTIQVPRLLGLRGVAAATICR